MNYQTYIDPHDHTRLITVKAITRAFGQMPGEPAPTAEPVPALATEVFLNGDRVATIGHEYGYTDNGPKLLPLFYALTKGGRDVQAFRSYTAARHWLWLDSEARESREYRLANH